MPSSSQPLPSPFPNSDAPGETDHLALEADAQDSIAKALWLFENGEKDVAQHMFERLKQRVRQAGPVAMLISGNEGAQDRAELQAVISAISDIAASKPEQDEG